MTIKRYVDAATGEPVITIINFQDDSVECRMCGEWTAHRYFVWYYEAPCCSLHPERGGAMVCKPCHDRWAAWDDAMLRIAEAHGVDAILHRRLEA